MRHRKQPWPLRPTDAASPPLAPEEVTGNLTVLQKTLNGRMKCPAGRHRVFLRSLLTPAGPTPPRVALKCHLRRDIGLTPDVFYEHIRDVCCTDPMKCEAYRRFRERFVST